MSGADVECCTRRQRAMSYSHATRADLHQQLHSQLELAREKEQVTRSLSRSLALSLSLACSLARSHTHTYVQTFTLSLSRSLALSRSLPHSLSHTHTCAAVPQTPLSALPRTDMRAAMTGADVWYGAPATASQRYRATRLLYRAQLTCGRSGMGRGAEVGRGGRG
eukprot:1364172-Rhodomonas_salina.2